MSKHYWAFMNRDNSIYWKAISTGERLEAMSAIEQVVSRYGFITDFHMFSDIEMSFRIMIEEKQINGLYAELQNCISLDEFPALQSNSTLERLLFLNITFVKGTGNLIIELPAVPG